MYNCPVLYNAPWIKGLEPSLAQPSDNCQEKTIQRRGQTNDSQTAAEFYKRERESAQGSKEKARKRKDIGQMDQKKQKEGE